ncbi:MAG: hypothetical protein IJX93_08710 [Clostridia bacterium]|nr:hypothetical protein [Clostridia bacterium]
METNAVRLTSSEPLPNRMLKIRKLFWLCLACTVLGLFIPFFMGVGILGFCIVYIIHNLALTVCRNQLRDMKFLYGDLTADELFVQLQSVLLAQYQGAVLIERDAERKIVFTFDGYIYDLHLYENHTFSLWWRMSAGKAFLSLDDYKGYRKLLTAYGILGYHIQQCCSLPDAV